MAKTEYEVPEIGTIFITKKRGQRTMRLRVDAKGMVQVSMPWMVPHKTALDFVQNKKDWIRQQQESYEFRPYKGMLFGKTLRLIIKENSTNLRTQVVNRDVLVHFGGIYDPFNANQTLKIQKAMMKALRVEAEAILLPRLKELAAMYGFSFASSGIKLVTGRWGSCDSKKHIVLSIYLTQLPIELIDYVILHELVHTEHMNHSQNFWSALEKVCPDYRELRKRMRDLRPKIYDAKTFMA